MNALQRAARFVVKPGVDYSGLFPRIRLIQNRPRCSGGPAEVRPEVSLNRLEGEDNGRCIITRPQKYVIRQQPARLSEASVKQDTTQNSTRLKR